MIIKRDDKDDCLVSGMAISDSEVKDYNGKEYTKFSIGMGKNELNEYNEPVQVTVWERSIPAIKKGDRVLVGGRLKITEGTKKDGTPTEYFNLTADFCIKETSINSGTESTQKKVKAEPAKLEPIDDDSLPF
jgi:single-stranded DNA-binding protein